MGEIPQTGAPVWNRHRSLPVVDSKAYKYPSRSPLNTTPDAVDIAPPERSSGRCDGIEGKRYSQRSWPVVASRARSALYCSRPPSCRLRPPRTFGPPGVMVGGLTDVHVTQPSRAVTKKS